MKKIIILIFLAQYIFAIDANLDIVRKNTIIPKIAFAISADSQEKDLALKIKALLKKDLSVSGHFETTDTSINIKSIDDNINYIDPSLGKLDLLVNIELRRVNQNNIKLYLKMHDLNTKSVLLNGNHAITNINRYPFFSHKLAIAINDKLKAPSIKWMDRFIIFARYTSAKKSEIVIADYTLTYQKVVVKGGMNIFPKWANKDQSSFYYTSYKNFLPELKVQDLYTSQSSTILTSQGMLVCSDVSFDTNNILVTMAPEGQPDIYIYNTKSKIKTRVTRYSGIDVGGSFVDNDSRVIFISDRLNSANVFSKRINTNGVERMVYHGKDNSQVTTHKNYIVYSSRETKNEFGDKIFNLYLISTKNDKLTRLTVNGENKFPKFSADGESILFTKINKNNSYIGIIRLKYNTSFLFKIKKGKIQSIDW